MFSEEKPSSFGLRWPAAEAVVAGKQGEQGDQDEPVGDEPQGCKLQSDEGDKHRNEDIVAEEQRLARDHLLHHVVPLLFSFILILSYWYFAQASGLLF